MIQQSGRQIFSALDNITYSSIRNKQEEDSSSFQINDSIHRCDKIQDVNHLALWAVSNLKGIVNFKFPSRSNFKLKEYIPFKSVNSSYFGNLPLSFWLGQGTVGLMPFITNYIFCKFTNNNVDLNLSSMQLNGIILAKIAQYIAFSIGKRQNLTFALQKKKSLLYAVLKSAYCRVDLYMDHSRTKRIDELLSKSFSLEEYAVHLSSGLVQAIFSIVSFFVLLKASSELNFVAPAILSLIVSSVVGLCLCRLESVLSMRKSDIEVLINSNQKSLIDHVLCGHSQEDSNLEIDNWLKLSRRKNVYGHVMECLYIPVSFFSTVSFYGFLNFILKNNSYIISTRKIVYTDAIEMSILQSIPLFSYFKSINLNRENAEKNLVDLNDVFVYHSRNLILHRMLVVDSRSNEVCLKKFIKDIIDRKPGYWRLTGPNGCGKSTLFHLLYISGNEHTVLFSGGSIYGSYEQGNKRNLSSGQALFKMMSDLIKRLPTGFTLLADEWDAFLDIRNRRKIIQLLNKRSDLTIAEITHRPI